MTDNRPIARRSQTNELEQALSLASDLVSSSVTTLGSEQHNGQSLLIEGRASKYIPKLTMYRMMFVSLTLGLGIWKAVASYRDQVFTLNTLDWVIGTALALTWFVLGGLSKKPAASSTLSWFFVYDYAHCARGTAVFFAQATLFIVKMCLYDMVIFDGGLSPLIYIFVAPPSNSIGLLEFVKIFLIQIFGLVMVTFVLLYGATVAGSCRWPLISYTNDPFLRSMDLGVERLSKGCGPLHRMAYRFYNVTVPLIGAAAALYCIWFPLERAALYGERIGAQISFRG